LQAPLPRFIVLNGWLLFTRLSRLGCDGKDRKGATFPVPIAAKLMIAFARFVVVRARLGGRTFVHLSKTVVASRRPHNRGHEF